MFAYRAILSSRWGILTVLMIRSGIGTHLNMQKKEMYAMVTLDALKLRCVVCLYFNTALFYWCSHTVQSCRFGEAFWLCVLLDRALAHIWICRRKRCTQWLHLMLWSCVASSVFISTLHFSIDVGKPCKTCRVGDAFWLCVLLDRTLAHIWICRRKRCTQWLHLMLWSCVASSVFISTLHFSIDVRIPCNPVESVRHFDCAYD